MKPERKPASLNDVSPRFPSLYCATEARANDKKIKVPNNSARNSRKPWFLTRNFLLKLLLT